MDTNILGFTSVEVDHVEEQDGNRLVIARHIEEPRTCPKCGTYEARLYRHGTQDQVIMDTPAQGQRVGIRLTRQRWRCRECGGTFWGDYEIIDETKRMTVRLRQFIERESLRRTFTSVAEDVGVDEKVIRNVFSEHVATLDAETKLVTPEWLGIDEIHLLGSPRAVLANLKERTVVELLRSRNKKPLWSFLNSKMDRRRVQLVTMDMWAPYRDLSRSTFPGATVVVDKFHVIRMASAALDAVRKEEGKKLSDSKRRQLMRGRHLVLRRSSDLAERDILLLQGMLAHLPRLKDAYEAKEAFYDWYDVRGVDAAREALEAWKASVPRSVRPAFGALLTALGNWEEEILAFFEHRATNAYVESLNNVIRAINRMGRGYSFLAIRAKVLYGHGRRRQRPLFSAVMDRSLDYMSHMVVPSPEGDLGVPFSTLLAVADHEDSPT